MTNPFKLAAAASIAATIAFASTAQAAPNLSVEGNKIVNQPFSHMPGYKPRFVPRGVNFPGFESWCTSNGGWDYAGHADAATAQAIASWKANTVRIPLNQDCWLGEDGYPTSKDGLGVWDADAKVRAGKYRAAVKLFVSQLHDQGLAVILDLHWSGPAGVKADNYPTNGDQGQKPMADQSSLTFWKDVATQFKSDRAVMFEAYNEPMSASGCALTWQTWRDGGCTVNPGGGQPTYKTVGMQQIVSAIRSAGASQPILLGGLEYANDLRQWLAYRPTDRPATAFYPRSWTPQLIAAFHAYNGNRCDQPSPSGSNCWDAETKQVAAQVPVVTTEFGDMKDSATDTACESGAHQQQYVTWADGLNTAGGHTVGYVAWWWNISTPADKCADLIQSWTGTPQTGAGTVLRNQLAKF